MKLEVKSLKKSFGEKLILSNITFNCESGRATGLLGRNGAGKTTTIRSIMGIISKDEGEVLLDGKTIKPYNVGIGYLPEERGLYPKIRIDDQLLYFASLRNMSKENAKKSLKYWLERLEMTEYSNKAFDTLSKGNQQKIQLIMALIHNPSLLILDEPFSGLDPVNALLLKSVVLELIKDQKLIIFSSHQMNFVEEFCQDIVMIHKGSIVLQGQLRDIKRSYERKKLFVRFRKDSDSTAAKLKISGVRDITESNEGYLITLEKEDYCKDVLKVINENKYDIDSFVLVEHSLNDIFIQKVGEE